MVCEQESLAPHLCPMGPGGTGLMQVVVVAATATGVYFLLLWQTSGACCVLGAVGGGWVCKGWLGLR